MDLLSLAEPDCTEPHLVRDTGNSDMDRKLRSNCNTDNKSYETPAHFPIPTFLATSAAQTAAAARSPTQSATQRPGIVDPLRLIFCRFCCGRCRRKTHPQHAAHRREDLL